jgi:hypothetical protein
LIATIGIFSPLQGKSRLRAEKGWTGRREQPHELGLAVAAAAVIIYLLITSLRLVLQSGNEAFAAPKLDCAAIRKPFGFADGIVIVSASQRLVPIEIAVEPNGICPVVCQVQAPSGWCDDRFMVGAVSAKIDSLFKARFVWFNPR